MNAPSDDQILRAAERFGVELRGDDVTGLREKVTKNLETIERLEEIPIDSPEPVGQDRSWTRVNPGSAYDHNEIITECDVPPCGDGLLTGLELGLKDNIEVAGIPMTAASELLFDFVPNTDPPIVRRILKAGGRIVAKTNLDELGNAGQGTNGIGGPISNPTDRTRTAGGSSGGSAVAVATGKVDASLGTDTGGSVRIPAAYCGVVGLKPSFGLVPMTGIVENTLVQDHVGQMASDVETVARVLEAIAGSHPSDPASVKASARQSFQDEGYLTAVEEAPSPGELTVGVIEESFDGPCRSAVVDRTRAAIDRLVDAGVTTRSVSVPHYEYGVPVKNGLSYPANAAVWRDCALPYRRGERVRATGDHRAELPHRIASSGSDLNEDLQAKIIAGALMMTDRSGRDYIRAHAGRDRLRSEFRSALSGVDVLLTPTMPDIAPPVEENPPDYDYGWNTRHPNIVQIPALTLPCRTGDDPPIGLQILGALDEDATVLGAASTFESVLV